MAFQNWRSIIIEDFKEAINKGNQFGALLVELCKAFVCINHPRLIAKINSEGVSPLSTNMISSFLCNRTQQTKII